MQLPFFYTNELELGQQEVILDEDNSRHAVQVLRMKPGDELLLTDGRGNLVQASIVDDHKKHCVVNISSRRHDQWPPSKLTIGISLTKNSSRFEWFLEKATEIGIAEIIPLQCKRTEKQRFRSDRMKGILVSAMLQSRQTWLPLLHEPIAYELLFRQIEIAQPSLKLIAHCVDEGRQLLSQLSLPTQDRIIILIGPEGDFTSSEIELATANKFVPVSLGNTRLRTETAGIVAASLLAAR